jgi:hypothetical protein
MISVSVRWLMGFALLFVVFTVLANIIEMADPLSVSHTTLFSLAFEQNIISTSDPGHIQYAQHSSIVPLDWLNAFKTTLLFDYNFLKGDFLGQFLRFIFLATSVGMIVALFSVVIGMIKP